MGGFLAVPVSEKENGNGEGHGLTWALGAMQGYRREMEDAHIATTDIEQLPGHGFFAVFDGHGGDVAAKYAGEHFTNNIMINEKFDSAKVDDVDMLSASLRYAHFYSDEDMWDTIPEFQAHDTSGCTAVSCLVTPSNLIIANCGDSRAIVVGDNEVKFATEDHKPTNEIERTRIMNAKGFVQMGRVNGNLAVSRALGDFTYKDIATMKPEEQKVSCEPDMTVLPRNESDEFVLLACDGIWDVMSNDQAKNFVVNQLKAGYSGVDICNRMLDYCLHLGSKDNMSIVLVLMPNAPKQVEGFSAPEEIPPPPTDDTPPAPQGGDGGEVVASPMMLQDLLQRMGVSVEMTGAADGAADDSSGSDTSESDSDDDSDGDSNSATADGDDAPKVEEVEEDSQETEATEK
jgi:serine/threonine protein phosphatase PrpC